MTAIVHLPSELSFGVRDSTPADEGYILKTIKETVRDELFRGPLMRWMRNLSADNELARTVNKRIYSKTNRVYDKLYATLGAVVACNPDPEHESQILGFAITERPNVCHFVFVSKPFRQNGIARALLARLSEPIVATHWTHHCEPLQSHVKIEYRPSLIAQLATLQAS